jgi:hypothetical protein
MVANRQFHARSQVDDAGLPAEEACAPVNQAAGRIGRDDGARDPFYARLGDLGGVWIDVGQVVDPSPP